MTARSTQPLADWMRPRGIDEMVGQEHLLGKDKPLRAAIAAGRLHSMVLWGPPGSGKTTLACAMAASSAAEFVTLSAVLGGVNDVRAAVAQARERRQAEGRDTILFVDEVHRFNKAQQDAFLPHIEDGTITFVGATTENPSFELNKALLSRVRVYVLKALTVAQVRAVVDAALIKLAQAGTALLMDEALRDKVCAVADGDARQALNLLEIAITLCDDGCISEDVVAKVIAGGYRVGRFDKGGEQFYDQISALHKSVRGSAPDAALYWYARMLDGGCDPLYIARRLVRIASEDIGNADPRALRIALDAWETQQRLGSPEGELAVAQAVVFLACAAKSNAVYRAFDEAMRDARQYAALEVPLALRNAPTELMRSLGYAKGYRYAHDEPDGYAAGEDYFPEELAGRRYYRPVARGLEMKIGERLADLRRKDESWSERQRTKEK